MTILAQKTPQQRCSKAKIMTQEELSPRKKLTYEELVGILCNLSARLDQLDKFVVAWYEAEKEHREFLTVQILAARLKVERGDYKTPYKKLLNLEDMVTGFIAYHEQNPQGAKPEREYQYDKIIE